jgi:hypothetical protein
MAVSELLCLMHHSSFTMPWKAKAIRQRYERDRVRKCSVTTDKGVIEETVELDDLGRIAKLSRKPDHWESVLGD